MIVRRITLERYACFGSAEFEFRRGLNLIGGGNDAGKSLLLAALPAALFGVEHGSRLRSWGETLSCRVTVVFDGAGGGLRLSRDLETNLVRLEASGADGAWRDRFAGMVPVAGPSAERDAYYQELERLFQAGGEAALRAQCDALNPEAVFAGDGRLAAGLLGAGGRAPAVAATPPAAEREAQRQAEIAALESELAADRADYRKGEEYLAWIRKRWAITGKGPAPAAPQPAAAGKAADRNRAAIERQRDAVQEELRRQGLPLRLPADLPELFDKAEGLRQELAALQLELTPLQRRRQGVVLPGVLWPLLLTILALAAPGVTFWLKGPWLLPLAAGCGALLLVTWGIYLVRLSRAKGVRNGLDQELQAVEGRRAEALGRQAELAEQFEAYGLSSTPVEMVKLQQACRRNEELLGRYRELCAQLGDDAAAPPPAERTPADDGHLRPEDLPDAEARLAALGESLQRREARLAALRDGTAPLAAGGTGGEAAPPELTEAGLLAGIARELERLTAGRYRNVRLEEGRLRVEAAPGRWAAPAACSRGTAACLVLAARMALCQLYGGRLPLPVDDLPGQLDQKRRQPALRALERFAADGQLLLAAADEELAKRAARERWHVVNLDLPGSGQPALAEEKTDAGQLHLL